MLVFKEEAWSFGKNTIRVAETNIGIQIQIHESTDVPFVFWFEVVNTEGVLYDSRKDEIVFTNFTSVEDAANHWFENYN